MLSCLVCVNWMPRHRRHLSLFPCSHYHENLRIHMNCCISALQATGLSMLKTTLQSKLILLTWIHKQDGWQRHQRCMPYVGPYDGWWVVVKYLACECLIAPVSFVSHNHLQGSIHLSCTNYASWTFLHTTDYTCPPYCNCFVRSSQFVSETRNSPHFVDPRGSLPHSEEPATCPLLLRTPENAFYIFNQQIYFIIWYLLDCASLI